MSTVAGQLVYEVVADLSQLDTEIKKVDAQVARSTAGIEQNLGKAEDAVKDFAKAAPQATTATDRLAKGLDTVSGSSRTASGNLARMAVEIAVLATGFGTVAAAATFALGAIADYAAKAIRDAETMDQRLERHAEVIRSIKGAYGEAAEGLNKYAAEAGVVLETQLKGATERIKAGLTDQLRAITTSTTVASPTSASFGMPTDLVQFDYFPIAKFQAFGDALVKLRNDFDEGKANVAAFREEVSQIASTSADQSVISLANELLSMTQAAFQAQQALGGTAQAIGVLSAAANAGQVALNGYNAALRTLQMGVPDMARAINAQTDLTAARKAFDDGASKARNIAEAETLDRNDAAAATAKYAANIKTLTEAFEARKGVITGATALEKDFGKTLESTTIAGLEGVARATAQARAEYEARNQRIQDSIRLGASEADVTKARALNEETLAKAIKNANAAAAAKGGGGGRATGSSGTDGFDSAIQRYQDQTAELKLQQEQASRTGAELYKLQATHRLYQAALKAGRSDEAGLADKIEATAEAYAKQRKATEDAIEAQRKFNESVKFTGDLLSDFVNDILTGSVDQALKSLGKSFLSASLDALITGKGPLAGVTGMAAADKNGVGGIIGQMMNLGKEVEKGAAKGTATGTVAGFSTVASSDSMNVFSSLGIDGKALGGGLTAIAGLAGAYGAGMSAGSVGQAVGGGAISGAMAGAGLASALGMAGNLALPGVGLVLGAAAGNAGRPKSKKEAQREREQLRRQFR